MIPKASIKRALAKVLPSPVIRASRRLRNFGFRHYCPICKQPLGHFYPVGFDLPVLAEKKVIGGGQRHLGLCPQCWCTDRERLNYLYLKLQTDVLNTQKSILHIAPERSLSKVLQKAQGPTYIAADLNPPGVEWAQQEGFPVKKIDIQNIPNAESSFDVFICNHVLEHVYDDRKAMREILRVLKPGGWALLQVPLSEVSEQTLEDNSIVDPKEREALYGQYDHVRLYGRDYKERLVQSGFHVEVVDLISILGIKKSLRYGLNINEKIFIARKIAQVTQIRKPLASTG